MAEYLYFSRDTKVYIEIGSSIWEVPIQDGFSFSQSTDGTEITLEEMATAAGVSRRGRKFFNNAYSPAEWSFSTYLRPFKSAGSGGGAADDTASATHAVEEALWGMMIGSGVFTANSATPFPGFTTDTTDLDIDFSNSNRVTLGTASIYFVLGACTGANMTTYKIANSVVNEASITFDINGIASITWSGMGSIITEESSAPTATIYEAISSTSNFIRNKLTSLTMTGSGSGLFNSTYDVTLTGGNITINNNISFLTPENLCVVNQPIGHVTGARSITGNFTAYLVYDSGATDQTQDLFEDLMESSTTVTNSFGLLFKIGGSGNTPRVEINVPQAHLEIPKHDISNVISLDCAFHALPSTIDLADELTVKYVGA